ncbi:MAG TPA: proton-conducting transporter membrane subunit, partial [bacterium]|nr:proton-conducting transporter membrane subunit [bacterium]
MDILNDHILSLTVLAPILGAALIALLPIRSRALARWLASVFSGVSFLLASVIFTLIDKSGEFDFQELMSWIPGLGISYHVGADGASAALLLTSSVVLAATLFASFREEIAEYKFFYSMILLSAAGAMGFFISMNLYLMILFYALAIFPVFMLIGMGSRKKGARAAVKFVLFMSSSVSLLFVGTAAVSAIGGSSEILDIYSHRFSAHEQLFFFMIFAAGFGIAVPLILLHSWLSDSVEEGPIAAGILICAIVVKMGAYGFFRLVLPAFPAATLHYNTPILVIAASGVVGGFFIAIAQKEIKRLIAFSTVAYMGVALIGLFAANRMSVTGSILHMVNHGFAVSAIFALLSVFCARGSDTDLHCLCRMSCRMPVLSVLLVFSFVAYVGVPFLNM